MPHSKRNPYTTPRNLKKTCNLRPDANKSSKYKKQPPKHTTHFTNREKRRDKKICIPFWINPKSKMENASVHAVTVPSRQSDDCDARTNKKIPKKYEIQTLAAKI
jgi:hypothetical protein